MLRLRYECRTQVQFLAPVPADQCQIWWGRPLGVCCAEDSAEGQLALLQGELHKHAEDE